MDDQMKRLSQQLQKDPAALRAIMTSQDGQQLLRRLTEKRSGRGAAAGGAVCRPGRYGSYDADGASGTGKPWRCGAGAAHPAVYPGRALIPAWDSIILGKAGGRYGRF